MCCSLLESESIPVSGTEIMLYGRTCKYVYKYFGRGRVEACCASPRLPTSTSHTAAIIDLVDKAFGSCVELYRTREKVISLAINHLITLRTFLLRLFIGLV